MHLGNPVGEDTKSWLLICPPLANERENSYRILVNLARHLARAGMNICRCDYSGCGESGGSAGTLSLSSIHSDIDSAMAYLREQEGADSLILLGLRISALFVRSFPPAPSIRARILVDPVLSGREYLAELRWASSIGSTRSRMPDTEMQEEGPQALDVYGFRFEDAFLRELAGISEPSDRSGAVPMPIQLLTSSGTPRKPGQAGYAWTIFPFEIGSGEKRYWSKRDLFNIDSLNRAVHECVMAERGNGIRIH
jgi:hypothetical protein